jgi:hypothetical protein
MDWIYILKCANNKLYVGQTKRLFRRFWEHNRGDGGVNTSIYEPEKIVAIYKSNRLQKFFDYVTNIKLGKMNIYFDDPHRMLEFFNEYDEEDDYIDVLETENNIAECLIINNPNNWKNIRGGKYIRLDVNYNFPNNKIVKSLPFCNCKLPCDVRYNEEKQFLYFRCAKKNMWDDFKETFEIEEEPCNFFMKFTQDKDFLKQFYKKKEELFELKKKSKWLQNLVGGMYEKCVGGCGKKYDGDNTIRYNSQAINLCFDCFINKNEELSKKYMYNYKPQCMINFDEL